VRTRRIAGVEVVDEEPDTPGLITDEKLMPADKLGEAKWLEIDTLEDYGSFEILPAETALKQMKLHHGKVISTRWVLQMLGDLIKARFVAREFASWETVDFFAPTSSPATSRVLDVKCLVENICAFTFDARRAFLHVPEKEYILVHPPAEWIEARQRAGLDTNVYWRMLKTLYGRRCAAQEWTNYLADVLQRQCGFEQYAAVPVFFRKPQSSLVLEVHMDDGHGVGGQREVEDFLKVLGEQINIKRTGPHRWDNGSPKYEHLKRERIMRAEGTIIRPSTKYVDSILRIMGMEKAKSVSTPMTDAGEDPDDLVDCEEGEATKFRSSVGVMLYLVVDRGDLTFVTKELSRHLKRPTGAAMNKLKRCCRYLIGTRDYAVFLPRPSYRPTELLTHSDSNWAGCRKTRRSTSCFVVALLSMVLLVVSRTQTTLALSSAEAEWYAAVSAAAEALFLRALLHFLGIDVQCILKMDSSGARGIAGRQGVGKVRTLELRTLWLQGKVKEGLVKIGSVRGENNVADIGTKVLSAAKLAYHGRQAGLVVYRDGSISPLAST